MPVQNLFHAPRALPSAQRAHSQGGRTLARGRPARQAPERPGWTWGDVGESQRPRVGGQTGTDPPRPRTAWTNEDLDSRTRGGPT